MYRSRVRTVPYAWRCALPTLGMFVRHGMAKQASRQAGVVHLTSPHLPDSVSLGLCTACVMCAGSIVESAVCVDDRRG